MKQQWSRDALVCGRQRAPPGWRRAIGRTLQEAARADFPPEIFKTHNSLHQGAIVQTTSSIKENRAASVAVDESSGEVESSNARSMAQDAS